MADCPCTSGKSYADCCEPYHKNEALAPTAEAVMRARYSAYAKCELDYLEKTQDPRTSQDFDRASARKWSQSAEWLGLEVLSTEDGGPDDKEGSVEFVARYKQAEDPDDPEAERHEIPHHEIARFRRDGKR